MKSGEWVKLIELEDIIEHPFRLAAKDDLPFLYALEEASFETYRQSSREMIRHGLISNSQTIILMMNDQLEPVASMTLRGYVKQLKIHSIAVYAQYRGSGYGQKLIEKALEWALSLSYEQVSLEVDANNAGLINWYESFGFEQVKVLEDYYHPKKHAIRMTHQLMVARRYLVVTDFETELFEDIPYVKAIRALDYIENPLYQEAKDIKIFNLCSNYKYQSVGYYVSLLAMARNQVAYPSASLIRDMDNRRVTKSIGEEARELIQKTLAHVEEKDVVVEAYFGQTNQPELDKLVQGMQRLYHAPLMQYHFVKKEEWSLKSTKLLSLEHFAHREQTWLKDGVTQYFNDGKFVRNALKRYEYDMAILIDPQEALPPSDHKALMAFEKAAMARGFYVEYITRKDYARIPEFDALFIRTTTNVNDYTYDFARYAYAEGLVVMDDPWSILRCANKIYLYEALKKAGISMPDTWVINKKNNYRQTVANLTYPIILKLPDSAFSAGVYKVKNQEEALIKLKEMFKRSELIIAQEFMPTEYDWRIGVLDGKPLYACKYYMAKDHWQIVNWAQDGQQFLEGDFEAVPVEMVPAYVIDEAVKSTEAIGDGLYGVDLKVRDDKVYIIEVNDNPSLEYHVEDLILGEGLYETIIESFYYRLENNVKTLRSIH